MPLENCSARNGSVFHQKVVSRIRTNVFARARDSIVVIQIAQGTKHAHGTPLTVRQHQPFFSRAFNLKHLNHRTCACNRVGDDILVYGFGVVRGLLEEGLFANDLDLGLFATRRRIGKVAFVDKIAAQLLLASAGEDAGGAEGLDSIALAGFGAIQVLFVDPLLVAGTVEDADTRPARVNVDGMIFGFLVQSNLQTFIIASVGGDLGGVEREDVIGNSVGRLGLEVHVVDAEIIVEPLGLRFHKLGGNEALVFDLVHDYHQLAWTRDPLGTSGTDLAPFDPLCPRKWEPRSPGSGLAALDSGWHQAHSDGRAVERVCGRASGRPARGPGWAGHWRSWCCSW